MDIFLVLLLIFLLVVGTTSFLVFKKGKLPPGSGKITLKRPPVRITFKNGLSTTDPGTQLAVISAKKIFPMIFSGILLLSILAFLWTMINSGYSEYWFYIILLACVFLYYVDDILGEIKIYENALTSRRLWGVRTYYFANLDCVETFNIITRSNKGIGFGYQLTKEGKSICRFDSGEYENLEMLEDILSKGHPAVADVDKMKPLD